MAKRRPRYKSGKKKGRYMSNRAIAAQKAAKKRKTKRSPKTKSRAKRRRSRPVAKKVKRRRRRSSSSKKTVSGKHTMEVAGAGAAFGYLEQMPNSFLAQMPTIQALGFDGTMAIALHFGSNAMSGDLAKWLSRASEAYAGSAGLEFGRRGLQMASVTGDDMSGDRPAQMAGTVSYDEATDSFEHGS